MIIKWQTFFTFLTFFKEEKWINIKNLFECKNKNVLLSQVDENNKKDLIIYKVSTSSNINFVIFYLEKSSNFLKIKSEKR